MTKLYSIKYQILFLVIGLGAILSFFMVVIFPSMAKTLGEDILKKDAEFIAKLLADNLSLGVQTMILDDGAGLEASLNTLRRDGEPEDSAVSKVKVFDESMFFLKGLYNEGDEEPDPAIGGGEKEKYLSKEQVLKVWSPLRDSDKFIIGYVEIDFSKKFLADNASRNSRIALIIGASVLAVTVVLAGLLASSIAGPINNICYFLEEAASGEGDLTKKIQTHKKGEIGRLANGFNAFISNLHGMISQIRENTNNVAEAAKEIFSNSEHLADGSTQQLDQTKEVAASIERISQIMLEGSERSKSLSSEAEQASRIANEGLTAVAHIVAKMNEINVRVDSSTNIIQHLSKRSEEIANIIDVINEIAGQTNLLALNAAIEAARAGTHGRGFAVVADEIRKLADQTTQSTTGIEDMVKGIQAETDQAVGAMKESSVLVDDGVQMADDANNVLSNVMDMSNHVSESIDELAELSIQQSETVSKINSNINMISQVTNESSESAQGLLKIAEELNTHMGSLKDIEGRFKL